jgi:hypothetical protein
VVLVVATEPTGQRTGPIFYDTWEDFAKAIIDGWYVGWEIHTAEVQKD